jgi:hypothetical protein
MRQVYVKTGKLIWQVIEKVAGGLSDGIDVGAIELLDDIDVVLYWIRVAIHDNYVDKIEFVRLVCIFAARILKQIGVFLHHDVLDCFIGLVAKLVIFRSY